MAKNLEVKSRPIPKSISVLEGDYRGHHVENETFALVKAYQPYPHKDGGFVTVKVATERFPKVPDNGIIRLSVTDENQLRDKTPEVKAMESDEETIERMRKRFEIL